FQVREGELKIKAVTDPRAAVAVDVALLRAIPALPGEWLVSGLVYDLATGLGEVVVPPAPIREVGQGPIGVAAQKDSSPKRGRLSPLLKSRRSDGSTALSETKRLRLAAGLTK